jgi:putative ABC transport system substrate-binding protein
MQFDQSTRREFITLLGGAAAAWPLAARAQQMKIPVIGFLNSASPEVYAIRLRAFRQGLGEIGYVEGHNVAIEYRWAEGQYDRLSTFAADLVRRQVGAIFVTGIPATAAAKAANPGGATDQVRSGHQFNNRESAWAESLRIVPIARRWGDRVKRREFITLLGGAAAVWPLAARAQQPVMPVIGFLDSRPSDVISDRLRAFRQGLKDTGYVEGENVAIIQRFAENQVDRLPELATDLVRRQVAVMIATGVGAFVAKAATATIPIVFVAAEDPVRLGLVANIARPGGNLTGINLFNAELVAKRLDLLRELVPRAARVAVLVNPADGASTETTVRDATAAARAIGLQIQILNADTGREIDSAFETMAHDGYAALFVGASPYLSGRRVQLAQLAAFNRLPATYSNREYVDVGGLVSYGTSIADALRQVGVYAGRILKGAKPADLPVVQASKFELVINANTARMLGLIVPDKLLVAADEVIE